MPDKKTLTPEEIEATKAEIHRQFGAMLEEDPDRAVATWIGLADGLMAVLNRRADVRAVEGRALSAKDQQALRQLQEDAAAIMAVFDPERAAEQRLERLDGIAVRASNGSA